MDRTILNLKMISKIPEYGRICKSSDNVLNVVRPSFLSNIKRLFGGKNRKTDISDVRCAIEAAVEKNFFYLDNENEAKSKEYIALITGELKRSVVGLVVLKGTTYSNDLKICSELELLISKIHMHIKEISVKANIQFVNEKKSA